MFTSLLGALCIGLAILPSPSLAQQYAGDVIPNSLPGVPGSELVYFRIADPKGKNNNLTLINYQNVQLDGSRLVPSKLQRAVIIIHGLNRDPGTYMSNMLSAINNGGIADPNINQNSVAIVTPYFSNGDDKNIGYPWTAGLAPGKGSTSNALVWQASYWASGANNQYPSTATSVSSYEALDQLIKYFDNRAMFPNMKHIVVGGHSLGAQATNRYAEVGNAFATNSPVSYYIANPNSYAWLSTARPLSTTSCPTYDNWREGFTNYTQYPMSYGVSLVNQGRAAILAQYNSRSKAYARGTQDTGDDSSTCAPYTAGANRNERFFNFIKAFPAVCSAPGTGQCDTIDYVNTGHDGGAMFASSAGLARLFVDNFYGSVPGSVAYDFGYPRLQAGDDPFPNPAFNSTVAAGPSTLYAGNMTYAGCYTDSSNNMRALKNLAYDSSSNTVELCTATCAQMGYLIAGMEYGSQCFCGNGLSASTQMTSQAGCTQACPGNQTQVCGNSNRLSVYSNGPPPQLAIPGTPEVIGNYNAYQCMTEATSGRALSGPSYTDTVGMTLETCATFCNGYKYFGTEYGQECYCGNYFNAGSVVASNNDCSKTCSGSETELCGAGSRLTTYQLTSGSSVSLISQAPPGSTPTAAAGSTATAAAIASTSACPATNGQTLTDSNGANYTIHCNSDSSTGSYSNAQATKSYLDCMLACDAASSTGCIGFTYLGAANGTGSGTCYLKSGNMGSYVAGGNNLISGSLIGASANSFATNISSTASSTSTSAPSITTGYCPSTDGQVLTDANGFNYTVHCASDSSTGSYSSVSATSSYMDCMTACDSASATGCLGFTYVGGAGGKGGGQCYLKQGSIGTFTPSGSNLISAVLVESGSSASSSTSDTVTASSTVSPTSPSPSVLPNYCPSADGQIITDANGFNYTVRCSSDSSTGSYTSVGATKSYMDCMTACDSASSTGCLGFTYVGGANGLGGGQCYLKSGSIGTFTASGTNLISAVLVGSGSSTPSGTVSAIATSTATSAPASTNFCPSADGQNITDSNGSNYTVHCSSDSSVGSYSSANAATSYLDCMTACDSEAANGCIGAVYVGRSNGVGPGICWLKRNMGAVVEAGGNFVAIVQAAALPL
ncbi:hypothetical protein QFC22_002486 [Naganishia vaughanmartiniae]|uniref:Uncharacterized protein n=1 Tax=Naganishia vaughanmartiniae TaxID=1424756 RepID=A0ACC2XE25_9TREE|nr:hypothetical protein QFC22_002486 [Naganishia vaughanmartiniae]